jgi:hypothetical protein
LPLRKRLAQRVTNEAKPTAADMNSTQKTVLMIGILALIATSFFAPYRWSGYNELRQAVTGVREDLSGSANAPLWSPPTHPQREDSRARVTDVRLDAGKLAIWWGAIALLTAAGIGLAADRRRVIS